MLRGKASFPMPMLGRSRIIPWIGVAIVIVGMTGRTASAQPNVVFHLDFSGAGDVSASALPVVVGSSVTFIAGGGPALQGGGVLNAGRWRERPTTRTRSLFPITPFSIQS